MSTACGNNNSFSLAQIGAVTGFIISVVIVVSTFCSYPATGPLNSSSASSSSSDAAMAREGADAAKDDSPKPNRRRKVRGDEDEDEFGVDDVVGVASFFATSCIDGDVAMDVVGVVAVDVNGVIAVDTVEIVAIYVDNGEGVVLL